MRKILIIEDEQLLREAYIHIISTGPYEVFAAANGQEAIDLCRNIIFDLILLDIMMPVKNGVEFMREFKELEHAHESRVIAMSNLSTGNDLAEVMKLGADNNFLKANLAPRELLSVIRYELESATHALTSSVAVNES